jgi:hypothetical protein
VRPRIIRTISVATSLGYRTTVSICTAPDGPGTSSLARTFRLGVLGVVQLEGDHDLRDAAEQGEEVRAGLPDQPIVQLDGEPVDLARQLGVGFEFQLLFGEVMIRLGLLECRLLVLADHDERRQEDRFQRHD